MEDIKEKKYVNDNASWMKEWHWAKNTELGLFPETLSYGSTKKAWWICRVCMYEWLASPNNRRNSGCPHCAKKVVISGVDDLETLFPKTAQKWHPSLNPQKPNTVAPHSNKTAWWICEKDPRHVFEMRIDHMTAIGASCLVCSNRKIIAGVNDLATTHPKLMEEWHWMKNSKLELDPTQITYGSNKKAWWICKQNHEWQAAISSRAGSQKCGCPICKGELASSFPEKAISYYLSLFFGVEERKKTEWLGHSELDIYIPQLNLAVEYDGGLWHKDAAKDLKKDLLCHEHGVTLLRVRERECAPYQSTAYHIFRNKDTIYGLETCIQEIFEFINAKFKLELTPTINIDSDYSQILAKATTMQKVRSVASNTQLVNTWNYNKNADIDPEKISIGSEKKVWWICDKGHEWQAVVHSRTGKDACGCPYCSGKKVFPGENDLQTLYPEIAGEWNFSRNTTTPNHIRPRSNKKFWWICKTCGYEYETTPAHRLEGKGCPLCARSRTTTAHQKRVMCIETQKLFNSIKEAGVINNINAGSISNCCRNVSKTAGGLHWKFVEE